MLEYGAVSESQQSVFKQVFSLSRDSIIYGLSTVLSQFIGFLLVPVYTRRLGTEGYGVIELLNTTSAVLGITLGMGVATAMLRFYAGREDEEGKRRVASTAVLFLMATSLAALILLEIFAGPISSLVLRDPGRDRSQDPYFFRILFVSLFFNQGINTVLTVYRARGTPVRYAAASIAQFVMAVSLNIVFVLVLHKGVLGVLYSELITCGILYTLLMGSLLRRVGVRISRQKLRAMLAYGVPLIPSGLAGWMLVMADRWILTGLMGIGPAGVYSLGFKFGMVIQGILVGPMQLAWLPFLFSTALKPRAGETYTRVFTYFLAVALFAAVALSALGEELVLVMATSPFHSARNVIPLVALSYVLYGCYFQMAAGIYIEGKTVNTALLTISGAVVKVALSYVLIPPLGIMGAGVATLIGYAVLPVGAYFISQRYYPIKYEWGRVVKLVLVAAVVFAACLAAAAGVRSYLERSTNHDGILQAGESWAWTYSHVVTEADLDAGDADGYILAMATASSDQLGGRSDGELVPVARDASCTIRLTVTDVGGQGPGGVVDAPNDRIRYEAKVTNTGVVSLSGVGLTDSLVDLSENFTLRKSANDDEVLDAGETWTWMYWYDTTEADLEGYEDGGVIGNTATVSCSGLASRSDSQEVPVYKEGWAAWRIVLAVTDVGGDGPGGVVDAAGDPITFQVVVTNTGDRDLTGVTLSDALADVSGMAPVESGAADKQSQVLMAGFLKVLLILTFPLLLYIVRFFRPDEIGLVRGVMGALPGLAGKLLRRKRPPGLR